MPKKQGFVIREKYPDGKNSVKEAVQLINKSVDLAEDGTPLWKKLTQPIRDAMTYEFSHANPNEWESISAPYVDWKRSQGFPDTIGIRSGALKRAVTGNALIKETKSALTWGVNPSLVDHDGRPVGSYMEYFHYGTSKQPARPLFGFTRNWVKNNIINEAVNLWVKLGWSKG